MAEELAKTTSTELMPTANPGSLAEVGRPEWLPRTNEGTEHITRDDMRIPRLSIAQGLSPQLKRGDPKYIDGLRIGDLFNDLTGVIYQGLPLSFHIVRADPPRWVEFIPRTEGGGIKDMNVPPGDPRTLWTTGEGGKREKPIATMFYDYIILLWPTREMIALSLKSSGIKHAKSLNGLIQLRNAPLWAGRYTVNVADEPSPNGPFPNYVIRALPGAAGFVQSMEEAEYLKGVFDNIKAKAFEIERDDLDPTETGAAGSSAPAGQSTGSGEEIPY